MKLWGVVAAVSSLVVVLVGCGAAPAPPVTIASLESVRDVTLSDGRHIHNTAIAGTYGLEDPGTCEGDYELAEARRLLVGRTVTELGRAGTTSGPVPGGYDLAAVYVRTDDDPYDAMDDDLDDATDAATLRRQCPPAPATFYTRPAPATAPAEGGDVYIDGGDDESRFCGRRWWC